MSIETIKLNQEQIDALKEIGDEWENYGHHRIYINNLDERLGLSISRYNTGNISSASLNGEHISNSSARKLLEKLSYTKVYYDLKKETLVFQCRESWAQLDQEDIETIQQSIIDDITTTITPQPAEVNESQNTTDFQPVTHDEASEFYTDQTKLDSNRANGRIEKIITFLNTNHLNTNQAHIFCSADWRWSPSNKNIRYKMVGSRKRSRNKQDTYFIVEGTTTNET